MAKKNEMPFGEPAQCFFIITPPGLEELAVREINLKIPGLPAPKIEKGGFLLECPAALGFSMNHVLRIPTAILLRVAEFKCRDLPKLYQKVSNIKWGQYLLNDEFELDISSSKSRLLNEKKIDKTFREGIARHFSKQPPKKRAQKFSFLIKVRFFNDMCTVSIDTSGELLFKRGYKTLEGRAPIRENLAAAMFLALQTVGLESQILVDPMCGTGTLLLESYLFWEFSNHRNFAFENHPDWAEMGVAPTHQNSIRHFVGIDSDPKSLQNFRSNISAIRESAVDKNAELSKVFQLHCANFLEPKALPIQFANPVFLSNPPYNERLRLPLPPKQFYGELIQRMASFDPVGFGVIIPKKYIQMAPLKHGRYHAIGAVEFSNGGIPVEFRIFGTQ